MAICGLTTSDNPYNIFTQYDLWSGYDENVCGYFTQEYLARITGDVSELSGPDAERVTEDAIDEIIAMNLPLTSPVTGTRVRYVKVEQPQTEESKI